MKRTLLRLCAKIKPMNTVPVRTLYADGTEFGTKRFDAASKLMIRYDSGIYETTQFDGTVHYQLLPSTVERLIAEMRRNMEAHGESAHLFGKRSSDKVVGMIENIDASFAGESLYPSVRKRAAQLLYSLVKGHPFLDGNKKIAAQVFLHYLEANSYAVDAHGQCVLCPKQVGHLVLMVAESRDEHREFVIAQIEGFLVREHVDSL